MKDVLATPTGGDLIGNRRMVSDSIPPNLAKDEYRTLLEISQIITSTLDLDEILDLSLQQLTRVVDASASSIWLINESNQRLYVASATGEKREQMKVVTLNIGQGIVGRAVQEKRPFLVNDVAHEESHAREIAEMLSYPAQTMICVPIVCGRSSRSHGAIQVINKRERRRVMRNADSRAFDEKDLFLLTAVADAMGIAIENAWLYRNIHREFSELRRNMGKQVFPDIIGQGEGMRHVLELAERVAKTNSTVLLRGESGTGKELVAQAVHNASLRREKPFIAVNCAALPSELLESEMFGHEKGAFTGAIGRKEGRFELANGGTLFLDEIGDMPTELQAKLLRVLQDRAFYRVGGTKRITCDVRIIAATNQDLESSMREGTFREDLFYRLNVITIHLPPLRERPEDIEELAQYFLTKYNLETNQQKKGFTPKAMELLKSYTWPGNVRECENAIEHAVVLGQSDEVRTEDLPVSLRQDARVPTEYPDPLEDAQKQFKREHIEKILQRTQGNRSRASEILRIQRTYLSRLIKELDIDIE